MVLFHNYFPLSGEQPKQRILAYKQNNRQLNNTISQILLLYKVWVYYHKLDSMKYLGYITDMSECLGAGVWRVDQNIYRFLFKNI